MCRGTSVLKTRREGRQCSVCHSVDTKQAQVHGPSFLSSSKAALNLHFVGISLARHRGSLQVLNPKP